MKRSSSEHSGHKFGVNGQHKATPPLVKRQPGYQCGPVVKPPFIPLPISVHNPLARVSPDRPGKLLFI